MAELVCYSDLIDYIEKHNLFGKFIHIKEVMRLFDIYKRERITQKMCQIKRSPIYLKDYKVETYYNPQAIPAIIEGYIIHKI